MIGIARIAENGVVAAAGIAAALLFLGVLVFDTVLPIGIIFTPVVLTLSGATIAFVVLRHGQNAGISTALMAAVMVLGVAFVLQLFSIKIVLFMSVGWLGTFALAVVLRRTVSLDFAVLTAVPVSAIVALAARQYQTEFMDFWHGEFTKSLGPGIAELQANPSGAVTAEQFSQLLVDMSRLMAVSIGNWAILVVLCGLFIARYWQAQLFNAGGFQKEFHALSLGKHAAIACIISVVLAIIFEGPIWLSLASAMVFVFFLQGLAIVHSIVKQRGMNPRWLVGMYALAILPNTVLLLGALGMADNLFRFRQR